MTTIKDERKDPTQTIGVGDWVTAFNKELDMEFLCVVALVSAGKVVLISISEVDANRLEEIVTIPKGTHKCLSEETLKLLAGESTTLTKVDVEVTIKNLC